MKMLYIANVGNRIGNFSYSAMCAAKSLGIEFYIAANFSDYAKDDDLRKEDEKKNGIHIFQVDFIRSPYDLRNIRAYKQIVEIIKREKIDVIHCNTPIGGVIGRLAGTKCRVKNIIYQAHGFHFYKGAPKLNWLIYYPIEKWLAHYTDILITINKEDYKCAKSFRLKNRGTVYYVPGVGIDRHEYYDIKQYRITKRAELGLKNSDIVIISVGELNANKNNSTIVSALGKINDSHMHYLICGVGEEKERLQSLAKKLGIENNIHLLGYRTDVKELYSASDIFVMPSFREGLSRSIMEAMACGLPCIVSKIRGNTDLIIDNQGGFLCRPDDVRGFAKKISFLSKKADYRNKMGVYNTERIKKFDISVVQSKLEKIYLSLGI